MISSNIQQTAYSSQLQSSTSVQSQNTTNGFSSNTNQANTNRSIMDTVQFSDFAQLLSQKYNNGETGEKKENDGDSDDRGSMVNLSSKEKNSSKLLDSLLQSNNTQSTTDYQSVSMKNILSAYGATNSYTQSGLSKLA